MIETVQLRAASFLTVARICVLDGEQYELGRKVQNQKDRYLDTSRRTKYRPQRKEMLESLGVVFPRPAESLPARAAQVSVSIPVLPPICCHG